MLIDIVGEGLVEGFCAKYTADYIDLFRSFELKKRTIRSSSSGKITTKIPVSFVEMVEDQTEAEMNDLVMNKRYAGKVKIEGDKIRIDAAVFKEFFEKACNDIVAHVKSLLQKPDVMGTKIILMVGGFSESELLQDKVRSSFPQCRVLIPPDAGLAVLKGAVIFGHDPYIITARKAKYTYGVDVTREFNPDEHPIHKKVTINQKDYCDELFHAHVIKGELLYAKQAQVEKTYVPLSPDQTGIVFNIYTCPHDGTPTYVDDPGCKFNGKLRVDMSDTTGGLNREVEVRMIFGATELTVEGKNLQTGDVSEVTLDLLSEGP